MKDVMDVPSVSRFRGTALLFLRVVTGVIYVAHGYVLKIHGDAAVSDFAGFLGSLSVPSPEFFAYLVVTIEIVGGLALIAGLWTRTAASATALVALFTILLVHAQNGFFVSNNGYEFPLLLLASGIVLATIGGGRYALDTLLGKHSGGSDRWSEGGMQ